MQVNQSNNSVNFFIQLSKFNNNSTWKFIPSQSGPVLQVRNKTFLDHFKSTNIKELQQEAARQIKALKQEDFENDQLILAMNEIQQTVLPILTKDVPNDKLSARISLTCTTFNTAVRSHRIKFTQLLTNHYKGQPQAIPLRTQQKAIEQLIAQTNVDLLPSLGLTDLLNKIEELTTPWALEQDLLDAYKEAMNRNK